MKTTIRAISAVLAVAFGIFAFGAAPAGAQTDPYDPYVPVLDTTTDTDPYQENTSTDDPYADGCTVPTETIDVAQAQRGAVITVAVTCFKPYSDVSVTMFSVPTVLGSLKVDAQGAGSKQFTVPCDKEDGAHTVTAEGINNSDAVATASAAVNISGTVCAAQATNTNNATNNLARTGATIGVIVAIGTVLLLGGYLAIRKAKAVKVSA